MEVKLNMKLQRHYHRIFINAGVAPRGGAEKRATRPRSVRKALTSPKSGTGRARKVSYSLAALPAAPLPDA